MIAAGLTVQRSRATLECYSCAAGPADAKFPAIFRRGRPKLCVDCIAQIERDADCRERRFVRASKVKRKDWQVATIVRRRASYRAKLRHREQSPQLDLVDILMPRP